MAVNLILPDSCNSNMERTLWLLTTLLSGSCSSSMVVSLWLSILLLSLQQQHGVEPPDVNYFAHVAWEQAHCC